MVRKIKGYTLFEILVVITLIAILSSFFIREILVYVARERLKATTEEFAANLNLIKTKSIISLTPHGFCFDNNTNSFVFFVDRNLDLRYATGETIFEQKVSHGITFFVNNINALSCPNAIIFDRRGEIIHNGTTGFSVVFRNTFGEVMNVTLNALGRISIKYGS